MPASVPWRVSVQVPPGGIQDREDPESSEQEAYEDHIADEGWKGSRSISGY